MAIFTKPGLSHSVGIGGTGICITRTDQGSLLIGDGSGFKLATLTAGSGVSIVNGDGTITISATGTYVLPPATPSTLGGVKVGSRLTVLGDGTINVPIASSSVLGIVKIGSGLSIDGLGVLSAPLSSGLAFDGTVVALSDPVLPPPGLTASGSGSSLQAGTYSIGYVYGTAEGGRTRMSIASLITITTGQNIQAIAPSLPSGATFVEFYVSDCATYRGDSIEGGGHFGEWESQSISGGGTFGVNDSHSISGGGVFGVDDSQSISGGGTFG